MEKTMEKDLARWFEDDLLPAVFDRLPDVFPEFGWKKDGATGWKATKDAGQECRPDRLVCRRPFGFYVHGEDKGRPWLTYMNGGTFPTGEDWLRVVRTLAQRVGMSLPEKNLSTEAKARMEARKKAGDVVEEVVQLCHRLLLESPEAEEARTYLEGRGLARERWEMWELGFMPKGTPALVQGLEAKGWKWEEAKAILLDAGLLRDKDKDGNPLKEARVHLHGRVVAPWRGAGESILGWWGRKLSSAHQDAPKYLYTSGTWRSRPYLLDRSTHGERLLLVEGVLDAIQCREHGFPAVALGGVNLDAYLLPLKAASPEGVVLVMDPDEAGQKAARLSVAKLLAEGFSVFMLKLPKGEKGEKGDPDEFLRTRGPEAFRHLVAEAPHSLRWKARDILTTHRGDGWTDQATDSAIREALGFAGKLPAAFHGALPSMFWDEIALEIPLSPETMQEHAKAIQEERDRETREKNTRAKVQETTRKLEELLEKGRPEDAHKLLLDEAAELQAEAFNAPRSLPRVALEEMAELEDRLNRLRGKTRMGMTQRVLPLLDDALLGLRGLMLLAGPPGTGKTSLAVQIGLGVLDEDPTAAVILLSLEQSRWEHLTRNLAYLSGLDWKTVSLGSHGCRDGRDLQEGTHFRRDDFKKLQDGKEKLRKMGSRLLILDDDNFPDPTSEKVLREVEALKEKTGASKVLVVVDYLQLWPVPPETRKTLPTDLDKDKWQIGELKKLRNLLGPEDSIMAISEARKEDWKASLGMGSVMGSARGTYTPDVVLVLQPLSVEEHAPEAKKDEKEKEGMAKLDELVDKGLALIRLRIVKGRDGVFRRGFELAFHFELLRFEETDFSSHL